ncbi:MAG: hypothetical protein ABUL63_02970, partial [Acidobacteriota bacterium]
MNFREIRASRVLALGLGLSVGLALLPTASAQGEDFVSLRNTQRGKAKSFWTPERLRAARPLSVPEIAPEDLANLETALDDATAGETGVSAEGRRPLRGIHPQTSSRLFDPADASLAPLMEDASAVEEIADRAAGSGGAQFTSQRLIPEAADQWY